MQGRARGRGDGRGWRAVRTLADLLILGLAGVLVAGLVAGSAGASSPGSSGHQAAAQVSVSVPSDPAPGPAGLTDPVSAPVPTPVITPAAPPGAGDPPAGPLHQEIGVSVGPAPSTAPATGVTGTVQQTVSVAVRPGGPLRVTPDRVVVTLHRSGHELVGTVGPVRITDPRGTLAGWVLRASLAGGDHGAVVVEPGPPVAVSGRPSEVTPAGPRRIGAGGAVLLSAPRGGGGGTFAVGATVVEPAGHGDHPATALALVLSAS